MVVAIERSGGRAVLIEFGEENVANRLQHLIGGALKEMRDSNFERPLPQPNGVCQGGVGIIVDFKRGHRGRWIPSKKHPVKNPRFSFHDPRLSSFPL